jgi:hypothetical protein
MSGVYKAPTDPGGLWGRGGMHKMVKFVEDSLRTGFRSCGRRKYSGPGNNFANSFREGATGFSRYWPLYNLLRCSFSAETRTHFV